MKILIVHAHSEPKSFCSALARRAEAALKEQGHEVVFADLVAEHFDPVSDRRNFTTVKDPDYFKQQVEEAFASEKGGFSPELEREIQRLEACEFLIFSFPIWWFGMPAILKGWVDRVFAYGRIYGGEKLYETGLGQSRKRAMVIMTTGGGADVYGGYGVNPSLATVLAPVQHGIFWFNGFLPLSPFIAWSPARATPEERAQCLDALSARLKCFESETPQTFPPLSDFPGWGTDAKKRFMVTVKRTRPADAAFFSLVPAEGRHIAELKQQGKVLSFQMTPPDSAEWRGYLLFRASNTDEVQAEVAAFPLAKYLAFEIAELAQV